MQLIRQGTHIEKRTTFLHVLKEKGPLLLYLLEHSWADALFSKHVKVGEDVFDYPVLFFEAFFGEFDLDHEGGHYSELMLDVTLERVDKAFFF